MRLRPMTTNKTVKINGNKYRVKAKSGPWFNKVSVYKRAMIVGRSDLIRRNRSLFKGIDELTEITIDEAVEKRERRQMEEENFKKAFGDAVNNSTKEAGKPSVHRIHRKLGDEQSAGFALELLSRVREE